MSTITKWMDKALYPNHKDHWDNALFRDYLLDKMWPSHVVLDYGAGRGVLQEMHFKGLVKRVAGVDIDETVLGNPFLDEAKVLPYPSNRIPYDENSFDLVFSANVMEHVQKPDICFKKIYRVLKPGGLFISKTPNKWHYVPAIARATPHSLHILYNKLRGREERDTFPTVYKCNTPKAFMCYAQGAGFSVVEIRMWEGRPEYLRTAPPLYLAGFLYERLVNGIPSLSKFRVVMVFALMKPQAESANPHC